MKNNDKVRDVRSLACKIKILNGYSPETWKWTIMYCKLWCMSTIVLTFLSRTV